MASVILFDVNGTLLDTHALSPAIRSAFGAKYSVREWFNEALLHAMAASATGNYREFGDIAVAVLEMAASSRSVNLSRADIEKVRTGMSELPPFPEVRSALARLRDAKFRLATLTNTAPSAHKRQLANANLRQFFEQTLSVDMVRRFKPAQATYLAAAQSLGVSPHEILMVAAHHWDLQGAAAAGCRTAFLARPGEALLPGAPVPDYCADDLGDLADQLTRSKPRREEGATNPLAVAAGGLALGLMTLALVPLLRQDKNEKARPFPDGTDRA